MTLTYELGFGKHAAMWGGGGGGGGGVKEGGGKRRKEGNVLFNDALNTFYLRLYGVGHMVKDHSDRRSVYLTTHSTHFIYGYMGSDIW